MNINQPLRKVWKLLSGTKEYGDLAGCRRLLQAVQQQTQWEIRVSVLTDEDDICMWLTDGSWMRLQFLAWTVKAGSPEQYNIPFCDFDEDGVARDLARVGDPDGFVSVLEPPKRVES